MAVTYNSRYTDFGTILTLTSASSPALSTTYNPSTNIAAGGTSGLAVPLVVAFANGTTLTDIRVKIQFSYDGTNWNDLQSVRQDTGATLAEQIITAVSNTTSYIVLQTSSHRLAVGGIRIIGKCTGTVTAGDSLTVTAVAA